MTRARKFDWDVIEREYIYDSGTPPISLTDLAERHGAARSGLTEIARRGRWFERREEFRKMLGIKATEKLGEEWVRFETAVREKAMNVGLKYLEAFEKALADGEIKVNTRDMVAVAGMLRVLTADAATARTNGEEVDLIDPDTAVMDPDTARRALNALEAMEARRVGPGAVEDAEAERPSGTGAD